MAKLSARGRKELNRREFPHYRVAIMSDGHVLRNYGFGWKDYSKLKPEVDPVTYAKDAAQRYKDRPAAFHAYMTALMGLASLEQRGSLSTAVSMMTGDPDGVYSTMIDRMQDNTPTFEECAELCKLYQAAVDSMKKESVNA